MDRDRGDISNTAVEVTVAMFYSFPSIMGSLHTEWHGGTDAKFLAAGYRLVIPGARLVTEKSVLP